MSSKQLSPRHFLLHAGRVTLFIIVLFLIRWQHMQATAVSTGGAAPMLETVQQFFPDGATVEDQDREGMYSILAQDGAVLGFTLQTSPHSDHIIGFSGPTNVMIAFDNDRRLLGIYVLSSGDTRDHLRQVVANDRFMTSLDGKTWQQVAAGSKVDGVSGATLTSLAIRESISHRLGGSRQAKSIKFPDPPPLSAVAMLFTDAVSLQQQATGSTLWTVRDAESTIIGTVLRTSPAADNLNGYQGPTETLIGFDPDSHVIGIAVGNSYDNEPYVAYVREDAYFRALFNGMSLEQLAMMDLDSEQVEGVSGATMTSQAIASGIALAAQDAQLRMQERESDTAPNQRLRLRRHDFGTISVICLGITIGMTNLRGKRNLRICFQLVLIVYLGLTAGNLVSQAMLVGWAKHGVPWRTAFGLVLLGATAFAIPITTRRNLYCTHLCPHGALQQLLRRRVVRKSYKLSQRVRLFVSMIPALLLLWCIIVAMTGFGFSLVDIEAFDAYLFRVAGWATIVVALVGLAASLLVPMAYCRYGCPTGALLQFLRFNSSSDRWSARDSIAVIYLLIAASMYVVI